MMRKLERALESGHTIIIENLGESLDAVLAPVIQRATIKRGRTLYVKVGDSEVEFHPDFRLYLHTKLSNPHYPPEIQAETTLINFTVTQAGLSDQLNVLVLGKERADLSEMSEVLVKQQTGFKIKMGELEDEILDRLANAEGDITEDVELIEGLEETKRISTDINKKSAVAKETQVMIASMKEHKGPVYAIVIKGDDTECVSASADGSCITWALAGLSSFTRMNALFAANFFKSVVYHPDESQLLTCGTDRKLTYWDVTDMNAIRIIDGSMSAEVNTLHISGDGRFFVSGGADKKIKLWHYDEGSQYFEGAGHSGAIIMAKIAPDEQRIVTVGGEGGIFIWKVPDAFAGGAAAGA